MVSSLPTRVASAIARHRMLASGSRVAAAVSGGADSVALLLLLLDLTPQLGLIVSIAHFDHRLRSESGADAAFVRELAARHGLRLYESGADVAADARARRGNLEQVARRARYGFLEGLVRSGEVTQIATGHTLDDQAETVLLRILRGAGTAGLAGIWPRLPPASSPALGRSAVGERTGADPRFILNGDGGSDEAKRSRGRPERNEAAILSARRQPWLIRPLLGIRREELRQWLCARSQSWREDASNGQLDRARNRIRHVTLPTLADDFNAALPVRLACLAEIARAEEQYWRRLVGRRAAGIWQQEADGAWHADCAALRRLPLGLRRRVVREGLRLAKGDLRRIDFAAIETLILRLGPAASLFAPAETRGGRRVQLAGVECEYTRTRLRLRKTGTNVADADSEPGEMGSADGGIPPGTHRA